MPCAFCRPTSPTAASAVNGVASPQLQEVLFSGNLSAYDPYKALSRGNTGLRVTILLDRLRALGYLADGADGIYGERTEEAVARVPGGKRSLRRRGTPPARRCRGSTPRTRATGASYIYLEKGDTGYRVRELNERLKALYYLEGTPGSTYNNATVAAVKRLQAELGLRQTGTAPPRRCKTGSSPPAFRKTAATSLCSAAIPTAAWPTCSAACAI